MPLAELITPQAEALTNTPWQEYPRPQLRREAYLNLNGYWDFTVTESKALPESYDRKILVPFCPESALSGIRQHFPEGSSLFYRRTLVLPEAAQGCKVLLHIGAADQIMELYVNQIQIGSHVGGYSSMVFDITHALAESNEIVIRVEDDLRSRVLPYGKQVIKRGGMWYTPVSGIWQTVWCEWVPDTYIQSLDMQVSTTEAILRTTPALSGTVTLENREYALTNGMAVLSPEQPQLWSPDTPHLYEFTVTAGRDTVHSYFALRTIEAKAVNGVPRLCLNGKPYFFHGLLDQGYWPDGLFTPADPSCFDSDILAMKSLGFNTLRKHIKVEPALFYYACDRLGMVVFQDMVNNGDYSYLRDTVLPTVGIQKRADRTMHRDPATRQAFRDCMETTVRQLRNYPCILYWTIFNEGWGQFDSTPLYHRLKELDGSRIIDTTSGWFRGSETDVDSRHIYFDMWHRLKPSHKPLVLSEFGGFVYGVPGHIFNPDKSYGYGTCTTQGELMERLQEVYTRHVLPAAAKGLCASIYTQISDVEDEINGLLTYDRKVKKADPAPMLEIARRLQEAVMP